MVFLASLVLKGRPTGEIRLSDKFKRFIVEPRDLRQLLCQDGKILLTWDCL